MTEQPTSCLIRPQDGTPVPELDMVHKVGAGSLEGGLLIMEGSIAPGRLIPSHTHSREDECSYIVSGELMFQVGGETVTAGPGCYVIKPRGVAHAFWNHGTAAARVMEIHVPDTFDDYYDHLGETMKLGQQERQEAQAALNLRYGLAFNWDQTAELASRYGLTL